MTQNPSTPKSPSVYTNVVDLDDRQNDKAKVRILIVDDSRTIRKIFSTYLSPIFDCVEAGSFDEALFELKKREFEVVITDIIMPGLSGIELLRKIIEDFPDTAVIVVSGVDRPQRALDAMRLGAFDYIIKPCEAEVLEITVERAIEHRRLLLDARKSKLDLEKKNQELIAGKEKLERLQIQIVQHEKMAALGQLAAGVAHELNNPIGFVNANLEMLGGYIESLTRLIKFYESTEISTAAVADAATIKEEIDYPMILEDLDSIILDCRDGSERIREIVQNLRTFSRLDEAEFKDTNIHEGINATVRLLSRYFSAENITLVPEYGDLPQIGAFSGQLNQVWMNLLVNAAQAVGKTKGVVRIITSADEENVYVSFTDTGCGIAVQHLKRIFEPFYTTKPVGEGTGLGLSISFGIVERHGGHISVDSGLNEGTTVKVSLPRHFVPSVDPDEKAIAAYCETI